MVEKALEGTAHKDLFKWLDDKLLLIYYLLWWVVKLWIKRKIEETVKLSELDKDSFKKLIVH